MSDKNRNISDINDQKTIDRTEQAFSEEIRRRLAEPDSGKPTLEEFKVMVYKDREKRRKKRNTLVACLVAAFTVGFLSFDALVSEVGADKNPKETIMTEDGVIIEDGGYGSSVGEENVWVITEWEEVSELKELANEIIIPKYIPSGYEFNHLSLEYITSDDCTYRYSFGETPAIEIMVITSKKGEEALSINEASRKIESKKGTIYTYENKLATIQMDDGIIVNIWYNVSDKELVKIVEHLEH